MPEKILLGYTGSWAGHMKRWLKGKKDKKPTPVYISRKKHKKLLEWEEMKHYSNFL